MPITGICEPGPISWINEQVATFEASNGAEGNTYRDFPVIILTWRRSRTGAVRKNPLMRIEHDGVYAIVASNSAQDTNPFWYQNVLDNPVVEVQDGPTKRDYVAHEASGDENALWWERAVEAYPEFINFKKKVDRRLPLLVLTPVVD